VLSKYYLKVYFLPCSKHTLS